jgi:hypothetical protein
MNGTSQPVPPPPGVPPAKKGMSPLAWVAIGCVVILIFCGIALGVMGWFAKRAVDKFAKNPGMAAAELMVRANPDLELVSKDEAKNSITVKDKKTGEVMTMSADDLKNGKFSFKTDKGSATFDASGGANGGAMIKTTDEKGQQTTFNAGAGAPTNLPSWLPVYPGGTVQGTMDTTGPEGRSAAFTVSSKDDSGKMLDFYEAQLKSGGFNPTKNTYNTTSSTGGAQTGGTVTGKSGDGKREVSVLVSSTPEGAQAVVTFSDKK